MLLLVGVDGTIKKPDLVFATKKERQEYGERSKDYTPYAMKKLPELDPKKTALELHRSGFKVVDYINGVQADRKRRLETFKKIGIPYLIETEEALIAYGESVISKMKLLNILKFMRNESKN